MSGYHRSPRPERADRRHTVAGAALAEVRRRRVAENEPLIEVETDKVTIEIPAPGQRRAAEILKQEQDEIAPGELLGRIQARRGEAQRHCQGGAGAGEQRTRTQARAVDAATTAALSAHAGCICPAVAAVRRCDGCCRSTGSTRPRFAARGAGGRITVDDVLDARRQRTASQRERKRRQRRSLPAQRATRAAHVDAQAHRRAHGREPAAHGAARHDGVRGRIWAQCSRIARGIALTSSSAARRSR